MADGYVIWLPFQLSPGYEITGVEDAAQGNVLGHPAQLRGNQLGYVLTVRELGSEPEAEALLDRLGAGLLRAATERAVGIKFSLELQTVVYPPDPHEAGENIRKTIQPDLVGPVDAIIDGDRTAVFRDHIKVYQVLMGKLSGVRRANP
jgi:hypothetical protein